MTRYYNCETFKAVINGREIEFEAMTSSTRNGFCHRIKVAGHTDTVVSYINRTWERFRYETALKCAIAKFAKDLQGALTAQLIDHTAQAEHERCEEMLGAFKKAWAKCDDNAKEHIKNAFPNGVQSEEDVKMATLGALMLSL